LGLFDRFWNSAHAVLTMATLMWAGHAVALRMSVGEISPVLLMQSRWLVAFIILVLVFHHSVRRYLPLVLDNWRWVFGMGGVGLAGFSLLLVYAAQYTTAVNLGIMQGGIPAFVMLFGWLMFQTRIGWLQFFGLCSSLMGILVLVSAGSLATLLALQFNIGDLMMVVACFCYGAYTLGLSRRLDMPPVIMLCFFAFCAFFTCSLFSIAEYARGDLVLPGFKGGLLLIYSAVFPTILAQTFFMRGVELTDANRAGLYVNLVPVFAAFLAVMILPERLYLYHLIALAMVLGGIYLAERGKRAN
jgi:drug/metabolite transporter (DMT)-like permease